MVIVKRKKGKPKKEHPNGMTLVVRLSEPIRQWLVRQSANEGLDYSSFTRRLIVMRMHELTNETRMLTPALRKAIQDEIRDVLGKRSATG
jgi:hypothetical protein